MTPAPASPPAPRLSATVILLDPARGGDEPFGVYLLKRVAAMAFMPGRYVFPGGGVEPQDRQEDDPELTLRLCALRELWEEAGVALARPRPSAAAPATSQREALRQAVARGEMTLAAAWERLGLAPDPTLLLPHARWITPLARPKRFDTMFYLAQLPPAEHAGADQQESEEGRWLGPRRALELNLTGELGLAPPQVRLLGQLAQAPSLEALWAAPPNLAPVQPILWSDGQVRVILFPWDPDYPAGRPADLAQPGCEVPPHLAGRLWQVDGVWRPLAKE
ncbi:MAG: NUDIX hydrolase [Deltaproteobacteria bacterium]|nr:NUDIX hydrolase [Deltaproteobacteria bacterium]